MTLWGVAACDPFHTTFADVEPAVLYQADPPSPVPGSVDHLRVMTYNIKYAGGRLRFFWECNGTRGNMTRREVRGNLAGLAAKIRQVDPDIVLLQEADIASKRCAYVDNVQWLLDRTALNFAAYASQWRADYVPSDGVGRVDSGNAILTRWPLVDAERLALPLIGDQDAVTKYFFLRRNILRARVALPEHDDLWVLATHTSAFSNDGTKLTQIQRLQKEMDLLADEGALVIAGGDLNALPPGSVRQKEFPDDCDNARFEGDDYAGEEEWLGGLYNRYQSAIPLADYQLDNAPHHSFTGDEDVFWSRKLDYLFTSGNWNPGSGLVHQSAAQGGMETIMLSDHAPLTAIVEIP